jgi:selenide,water dikinase
VLGLVHPRKIKRNSSGKEGDALILGKPLGVGILSAALKKGKLSDAGYAQMVEWTTKLNTPGEALSEMSAVHALTDVTGFGLAGHLLEICRGSKLAAEVSFNDLPLIEEAVKFAKEGLATGASDRNLKGYGHELNFQGDDWKRKLLTDPQTSGGLLVACDPNAVSQVLETFKARGFERAAVIGKLARGPAKLIVT